jgi:osmoprotectant transport system ATP-binding protein
VSESATTESSTAKSAASDGVGGARILLDGVTKRYDARSAPAVDNITLEIPAGEIVMLVGPSGCGKTTTMKMINPKLTNEVMLALNAKVDTDGEDPALVARAWLIDQGLLSS